VSEHEVCPLDELPPGTVRIVTVPHPERGTMAIGVYNCGGELYALEDRCTHDDGPLCEGDFDCEEKVAVCPRHGARFDITSGRALTLPAYIPVDTFPVRVRDDGVVVVEWPAATA
jgi:3-phenylpropionate/trans-cinnamate dioxygenase ferredoxin subunit